MIDLHHIYTPTLLVDETKTRNNIARMQAKAKNNAAVLRPHFKTHQSGVIGKWFRDYGIDRITVSSVGMAAYFAQHGWVDISIAFPVNLRELREINQLLSYGIRLNLLVESEEVVAVLANELAYTTGIFIKIDSGAGRSGIPLTQPDHILSLAQSIKHASRLELKGLLTHAGQSYRSMSKDALHALPVDTFQQMQALRTAIGKPELVLSWGDTPSCSILNELAGFDEWRAGNFVFYDLMQYHLGACSLSDIAVAMACPVVAVHPERDQLVIYGGSIHFSAEFIAADNDFRLYGYVVSLAEGAWLEPIAGAWLRSLSQEHGIVQLPKGMAANYRVGELIGILPVHSCLTVNAMGAMRSLSGEEIGCFI